MCHNSTENTQTHCTHPQQPSCVQIRMQSEKKKTDRNSWENTHYVLWSHNNHWQMTNRPQFDTRHTSLTLSFCECNRSRDAWIEHPLLGSGYEDLGWFTHTAVQRCFLHSKIAQTHNRPWCRSHMSVTMTTREDVSGWPGVSGWFINVWWSELVTQRKWAASG